MSAEAKRELRDYLDKHKNYPGLDKLKMKDRRKHQKATRGGPHEPLSRLVTRATLLLTLLCSP